jgi:hypothetical protein
MEEKRMDLRLLMAKLCKVAGVEPTSDFREFTKRLHEVGFLTDEEINRIEQYLEHR